MIKITPFLAALTITLAGCDNNASNTMQHDAMSSQDSMTKSSMSDGSMAKDSMGINHDSMSRDEMPDDKAKSDMDHDAMTK
jgi:hypothetical protein